jgi:PPK2 family polyphosphate:nucleotide phosphotransferase
MMPDCWTHDPRSVLTFRPGDKIADVDTSATPGFTGDRDDAPPIQVERNEHYAELQEMLFANSKSDESDRRSVLLVLQGMDTAGKGGIVKHVVGAGNPQGIRYTAFGVPTEEERNHHYLWRIRNALPPAGHIGVFDRSHYEDVLVVCVRNLVPPEVWGPRYEEINAFERELVDAGTALVKVAMFISLDEQKRRLAERLARPDKYWKYNSGDIAERKLWPDYQEAYQAALVVCPVIS